MKKILILAILAAIVSSCSSVKKGDTIDAVTLSGQLSELGMNTFQYGTHRIMSGDKVYALKSSKVNLNRYLNKSVVLKGTKVSGYPIEGGSELIEVWDVSVSK